ncbi:IS30 family transposase [Polaribacter sp. R77954]|uniref:IS30 family transposase n=1 Tax=Polaribacter sp. R77954 TaxID=3093870 RepID=UPI0037C76265
MKKYKQLTLAQRYQIEALLQAGITQTSIAIQLGVDKSTISRELKRSIALRGRTAGKYIAANAERKTRSRHKHKFKRVLLTAELKSSINAKMIVDKWSPELISKKWKQENIPTVSHETIYKWIWQAKHTNTKENKPYKELYKELKHGKRRQKRGNIKDTRGAIKNRVHISERPAIIEKRQRIGDLEADLMMGKDHKSALLVLTDRTTLITMIDKLTGKTANEVTSAIKKRLSRFNSSYIKSITFDNGKEFAGHKEIAKEFNVKTYFTTPYTSQEKGTVENKNEIDEALTIGAEKATLVANNVLKRVREKIGY